MQVRARGEQQPDRQCGSRARADHAAPEQLVGLVQRTAHNQGVEQIGSFPRERRLAAALLEQLPSRARLRLGAADLASRSDTSERVTDAKPRSGSYPAASPRRSSRPRSAPRARRARVDRPVSNLGSDDTVRLIEPVRAEHAVGQADRRCCRPPRHGDRHRQASERRRIGSSPASAERTGACSPARRLDRGGLVQRERQQLGLERHTHSPSGSSMPRSASSSASADARKSPTTPAHGPGRAPSLRARPNLASRPSPRAGDPSEPRAGDQWPRPRPARRARPHAPLRRWLLERAPQITRSGAGVATRRRPAGGHPQHRHARRVGGGARAQQVPRDPLALRPPGREEPPGLDMQPLTLERRDLLLHRAAHHRMHEVERALGRQHVDADQRVGLPGRHRLVRPGERRHLGERTAGAGPPPRARPTSPRPAAAAASPGRPAHALQPNSSALPASSAVPWTPSSASSPRSSPSRDALPPVAR